MLGLEADIIVLSKELQRFAHNLIPDIVKKCLELHEEHHGTLSNETLLTKHFKH